MHQSAYPQQQQQPSPYHKTGMHRPAPQSNTVPSKMMGSGDHPYLGDHNINRLFHELSQKLGLNVGDPSVQQRYRHMVNTAARNLYKQYGDRYRPVDFNKHCLTTCANDIMQRRKTMSGGEANGASKQRMSETAVSSAHRQRELDTINHRQPMMGHQRSQPSTAANHGGVNTVASMTSSSQSSAYDLGAPIQSTIEGSRPYYTATGELGQEMYMGSMDDGDIDQQTIDAITSGRPTGQKPNGTYVTGTDGKSIFQPNFTLTQGRHQSGGGGGTQYDPNPSSTGQYGGGPPAQANNGYDPSMMMMFSTPDTGGNFSEMGGDPFASIGMNGEHLVGTTATATGGNTYAPPQQGGGTAGVDRLTSTSGGGSSSTFGNSSSQKMSELDARLNEMKLQRAIIDQQTHQPMETTMVTMRNQQQPSSTPAVHRQGGGGPPATTTNTNNRGPDPTQMNPMVTMQQQIGQMAHMGMQMGLTVPSPPHHQQQSSAPPSQYPSQYQPQFTPYQQPPQPPTQFPPYQSQMPLPSPTYQQPPYMMMPHHEQQSQYQPPQAQFQQSMRSNYIDPMMQHPSDPHQFINSQSRGGGAMSAEDELIASKVEAMRAMKKKLTKMAIELKKKERRIQAQLVAQNKKEMHDEVVQSTQRRSVDMISDDHHRRRARSPQQRSYQHAQPAHTDHRSSRHTVTARTPSPVQRAPTTHTVTIDCAKITDPTYYNDYVYEFSTPLTRVRGIYLQSYEIEREISKMRFEQVRIRFGYNGDWMTAVIQPGQWTEESFIHEIEHQMGSDVYTIGRDVRTGHLFIKRLDGHNFSLDTNSPILTRLGFANCGETDPAPIVHATTTSNLFRSEWHLYVDDTYVGPLDNKTTPIPIDYDKPIDTMTSLKIQIKDRDQQLAYVGNSSHTLIFEIETD